MKATRESQGRDEQVNPTDLAGDPDPGFAEVDLQLAARRRLVPNRRPRLRSQFAPPADHSPLDVPEADDDAMLGCKLLADDIRVSVMAKKPVAQPGIQPIER